MTTFFSERNIIIIIALQLIILHPDKQSTIFDSIKSSKYQLT